MVHGSQTRHSSCARLTLALAAAYEFDTWTTDFKLAYLQSIKPLERKAFIHNEWLTFPIVLKNYKLRRVTRSVLSAEVVALADLFDDVLAIRSQLEQSTLGAVPVHLLTDSKSLFDIISNESHTIEKRIMFDVNAACEAYKKKEISKISFVRSSENKADGLTKRNMRKALLSHQLNGDHKINCEQWILR